MSTDRENYLKLAATPNVIKNFIHGGPRCLDVILTYLGKEIASKREFYTRGKLDSQYYAVTEHGKALLMERDLK